MQIIKRDYPYVFCLEPIKNSVALQLLSSFINTKEVIKPSFQYTISVIGILGKLNEHPNEPDFLRRTGFLGALTTYASEAGIIRLSIISIPSVALAKCQLRNIHLFLLMIDAREENWELKLRQKIIEFNDIGVFYFLIFIHAEGLTESINDIANQYPIIAINDLTYKNVLDSIIMINRILSLDSVQNAAKNTEIFNKRNRDFINKSNQDLANRNKTTENHPPVPAKKTCSIY